MICTTRSKTLLTTLALTAAFSVSSAVVVPETSEALDFKKLGRNLKKDFRKAGKGIRKTAKGINKSGVGKLIIQGVGVGLIAGGIGNDSAAAMIIGVALVAAPEIFRADMARTYGNDMQWSGCTRCYKQRIVVAPGREVSKTKKNAISAKVKEDIKDIQRALAELGLYNKGIDGDFGKGSRTAVRQFQASLGTPSTGYLTAEERYLLFTRAVEKGYVRQAALNKIDEAEKTAVPTIPVVAAGPVIREYRLAQSQFGQFADAYLKAGTQSAVADAQLQPDGLVAMDLKAIDGQQSRHLVAEVGDLEVKPHSLSDQWIRIVYNDPDGVDPLILNTRDDFASIEEAAKWMQAAQAKMTILAKLTGAEPEPDKVIVVADEPSEAPKVDVAAAAPAPEAPSKPGETKAGSDGRIVLAEKPLPEAEPEVPAAVVAEAPKKPDVKVAETKPQAPEGAPAEPGVATAEADGSIILANAETPEAPANSLTGFDVASADQTCRQSVYVSFKFPNGDNPISHYNIEPPEGTIQVDNGDQTAYFTGSCIQGNYKFSYVAIQEGKAEADWKHAKKEGAFEIASNSEQCDVDLNTPDGSASLQCF